MTPIFYDNGKRWTLLKRGFVVPLSFIAAALSVIAYALIYSPDRTALTPEADDYLTGSIEKINSESRPVIDAGTFMTLDPTYDDVYVKRYGEYDRRVILTFDDGPDPVYTPKIMQILKEQNVPATFFIIGEHLDRHPEIVRGLLDQGFDVGLHTFTHFENLEDRKLTQYEIMREMDFPQKLFAYHFGYKSTLFRIPYVGVEDLLSYHSLQLLREALARGYTVSAPTVDSIDWAARSPADVIAHSTRPDVETAVILLHDGGGDRESVLSALPAIIEYYRSRNYTFTTVSAYAGEYGLPVRTELTPLDRILIPVAVNAYTAYTKLLPQAVSESFLVGFIIVMVHSLFLITLAIYQKVRSGRISVPVNRRYNPKVTILIPMYNEEASIRQCVLSALGSSYKNLEIIVADDGSTDDSIKIARAFRRIRGFRLLELEHGGKSQALNAGIAESRGSIIITLDADTRLTRSAVGRIVRCFRDKSIGSASGNVRVGNHVSLLTETQSVEYTVAQTLEKRVMDVVGAVTITPGAFGAWRKQALRRAGRFTSDTLAEDFDLTLRVIKRGFRSVFVDHAIAYTEVPDTLSALIKQRLRWYYGNLQVLVKHRDMIFRPGYGLLGMLFLPRMVLLQLGVNLTVPIVDLMIIINIVNGYYVMVTVFFILYILFQKIIIDLSYSMERRTRPQFSIILISRLWYSHVLSIALYRSILRALKGQFATWQKTHHTGRLNVRWMETGN